MIIEELIKLDDSKRKTAAVLVVLVVLGICYFTIIRGSVVKLRTAQANYTGLQTVYDDTEHQKADFPNLQKQLEKKQKQLQEYQRWYFSSDQAVQFFENINSMALAHNLRPISRAISEPKPLSDNKDDAENSETQQQFLESQSATVAVYGNYFNIVNFVQELVNRPQRVCMSNFRISLPGGERSYPKASFKVTLLIDSSKGQEQ